jgi:hypothetical protein
MTPAVDEDKSIAEGGACQFPLVCLHLTFISCRLASAASPGHSRFVL